MPDLVNYPNQPTLLECLKDAAKRTTGIKGKRIFYAITCYFDSIAVKRLASSINSAIREAKGQLIGFYVYVDSSEWVKYRGSKEELIQKICKRIRLDEEQIDFIPINFTNRLFHAKSYALVDQKNRKGFVATTSGNLTRRGLGIGIDKKNSNIEFVEIIDNSTSIEDFFTIINHIEEHTLSKTLQEKQDNFLLALRILSAGSFYHKWEGNLSSEVRFKLTLTDKGINALEANNSLFRNYKNDSKSISRDPINLQSVFNNIPKPFPKQFWATYSVDTLLGRWIPEDIASKVDEVLENNVQPYIEKIRSITNPENLQPKIEEIRRDVDEFNRNGYVKEKSDDVIHTWLKRIKTFRDNKELITLRIYNYEKIPEILDSSNRKLILETFERLHNQINMRSKPRGLKAIINRVITNHQHDTFKEELKTLSEDASEKIEKYSKVK